MDTRALPKKFITKLKVTFELSAIPHMVSDFICLFTDGIVSPLQCRFVKLDGVFYIQLEQSEAGQVGFANTSTAQWKPIDRRVNITRSVRV